MAGWFRPQTSATTEIQPALPMLRGAARDLVRNSPHASRAVRVLAAHIAGSGVRPRAVINAADPAAGEALGRVVREQWERFVERCDPAGQTDWYGQQRLLARAVVEGGEAIRIWTPLAENGRLFWRCQVVEGDVVDHHKFGVMPNGNRIVQGVEFDRLGRRVAYHLLSEHPGERYAPTSLRYDLRRVPAEFVDHAYEILRPGQVRGVPWFAPAATVMRDVDDLAEAEVVRKKLEACLAIIVTNANDDAAAADGPSLVAATDASGAALRSASGATIERMQPGMVVEARPGWDAKFTAPPASDGLVEHMRERLHAIAAGVGVTYMQMTGDTSQANYSSMREGRLEFHRLVDCWQADLMITQTGRPAWRRVMDAAILNGDLRQPVAPRATFIAPKRPWVDPQKDAKAAIDQMAAGIIDPHDVIEETGHAPEDVIAGLTQWRDRIAAAGLQVTPNFGAGSGADTRPTGGPEPDNEGDSEE
ncbi:MAG: phage portal protein [Rhodobacteraceae bacterium]|nr:phage portal protein [Paracoccaceae bacterium]